MRIFKKILLSVVVFLVVTALVSAAAIYSFFSLDINKKAELNERNAISGKIETLFIGSSRGLCAFVPEIANNKLKTVSYNLCGSAMSPNGIYALLLEEIDRNPVKTVVIDVGDDTLSFDQKLSRSEGEITLVPRFRDGKTRLTYFFKNVNIKDYPLFYANYLNNGISSIKDYVSGSEDNRKKTAGFNPRVVNNLCLSNEEIIEVYRSEKYYFGNQENHAKLSNLIQLCKSKNVEVVLVSLPVSECSLWKHSNYSELHNQLKELSTQNGCTYYDFNLLKNRSAYFSDETSFFDNIHLSEGGANQFTNLFCEIMKKVETGEDVSDMFYDSYDEAIKHMEYYKIYQELMKEKEND